MGGGEVVDGCQPEEHRCVDVLTSTRVLPSVKGGQDATERHLRRSRGRERRAGKDRALSEPEVTAVVVPGLGGDHAVITLELGVRRVEAEPGDGTGHEAGVRGAEVGQRESPFVQPADTESGEHDVGGRRPLSYVGAPLGRTEVGDEALLAPVPHEEPGAEQGSEAVTFGRLDLDDAGTVVGEQHAGHRRRHAAGAQFEYGQAIEG